MLFPGPYATITRNNTVMIVGAANSGIRIADAIVRATAVSTATAAQPEDGGF
jgi:K+/H+ antiporter YhaU regulatory subunit KhtT